MTAAEPPSSEGQRLGAPVDLGAPVPAEGLDWRPWQRVVGGEQPAKRFGVVKPAVEEHRQRPAKSLDDVLAVEEGGRNAALPVRPGHGDQFAVAEQLLHPAGWDTEPDGYLGK